MMNASPGAIPSPKRIDDGGGAGGKCADMERQHHVLRHHLALGVHQRAGGILRLPHDGGESGAKQRVLHLLHDAGQARLDDFEIDRVDDHLACLPALSRRVGKGAWHAFHPDNARVGAVPTRQCMTMTQLRVGTARVAACDRGAVSGLRAFAHPTAFRSYVTIRFFHSSTRAVWPGQITVVQSN